ncbi:Uncharacterized protein PRO82_001575 [Candidatus Protochlamydia amoebophila]|nr:Uncharacterized protein [Candidatus Protochlamydia amoebophila]
MSQNYRRFLCKNSTTICTFTDPRNDYIEFTSNNVFDKMLTQTKTSLSIFMIVTFALK